MIAEEEIFNQFGSVQICGVMLITVDDFKKMVAAGLINKTKIRNQNIINRFKQLKKAGMKSEFRIDKINQEYPYLQFDTIRKICYGSYH